MEVEKQDGIGSKKKYDPEPPGGQARDHIRILVVDRLPVARQGLAVLLNQQADFFVVGQAASVNECRDSIAELEPDVVVFESEFGDSFVDDALAEIRDVYPGLPLVVLANDEYSFDIDGVRSGVQSCLLKSTAIENLYRAVRIASEGGSFTDPALRKSLSKMLASGKQSEESESLGLTVQEMKVLRFLAEGCTNDQIAKSVFLCESTVKFHLRNTYQKLDVSNRTMAVKVAVERGILNLNHAHTSKKAG